MLSTMFLLLDPNHAEKEGEKEEDVEQEDPRPRRRQPRRIRMRQRSSHPARHCRLGRHRRLGGGCQHEEDTVSVVASKTATIPRWFVCISVFLLIIATRGNHASSSYHHHVGVLAYQNIHYYPKQTNRVRNLLRFGRTQQSIVLAQSDPLRDDDTNHQAKTLVTTTHGSKYASCRHGVNRRRGSSGRSDGVRTTSVVLGIMMPLMVFWNVMLADPSSSLAAEEAEAIISTSTSASTQPAIVVAAAEAARSTAVEEDGAVTSSSDVMRTSARISTIASWSDTQQQHQQPQQSPPVTSNNNNNRKRYWTIQNEGTTEEKVRANTALLDLAVMTINSNYYDKSGGVYFEPHEYYRKYLSLVKGQHDEQQQQSTGIAALLKQQQEDQGNSSPLTSRKTSSITYDANNDNDKYMAKDTANDQDNNNKNIKNSNNYHSISSNNNNRHEPLLGSREGTVLSLKWLVSQLHDPYSKYMTKEEARREFRGGGGGGGSSSPSTNNNNNLDTKEEYNNGQFLGIGAMVEMPPSTAGSVTTTTALVGFGSSSSSGTFSGSISASRLTIPFKAPPGKTYLSIEKVSQLPVVTAVVPYSPAERAGVTVGDRIVSVHFGKGHDDNFLLSSPSPSSSTTMVQKQQRERRLDRYTSADNYYGYPELTIAKPVVSVLVWDQLLDKDHQEVADDGNTGQEDGSGTVSITSSMTTTSGTGSSSSSGDTTASRTVVGERDVVVAYRPIRVKLPTMTTARLEGLGGSGGGSSGSTSSNVVKGTAQLLPEASASPPPTPSSSSSVRGGNSIVHYELLTPQDSILFANHEDDSFRNDAAYSATTTSSMGPVGYIRLTRFSKSATAGFVQAVDTLEKAGATSFIIDLRNNYGGMWHEAMLLASSLLRDPHAVLSYTLNARGGLTPHDVQEYVMEATGPDAKKEDSRYPGYLLSSEPRSSVINQINNEQLFPQKTGPHSPYHGNVQPRGFLVKDTTMRGDGILSVPASSFRSLHQQAIERGIHRVHNSDYSSTETSFVGPRVAETAYLGTATTHNQHQGPHGSSTTTSKSNQRADVSTTSKTSDISAMRRKEQQQRAMQKDIVILVNEGTASSAEVFSAALRDNNHRAILVGSKTYGKGLIQHTFPMPDGGVLKLTVAEYLTPSLHHVTHVGNAQFDNINPENNYDWGVGGGIIPDVKCESKQGIPNKVGADLCVGMALDVLNQQHSLRQQLQSSTLSSPQGPTNTAGKTLSSITTAASGH